MKKLIDGQSTQGDLLEMFDQGKVNDQKPSILMSRREAASMQKMTGGSLYIDHDSWLLF